MKKNAWGRTPPYLWSMPIEIKPTLKYLKELEEQLSEFELSDIEISLEMHKLYKLIEKLMDMTFKSKDDNVKVRLALSEKKARECYDCIKGRLVMQN